MLCAFRAAIHFQISYKYIKIRGKRNKYKKTTVTSVSFGVSQPGLEIQFFVYFFIKRHARIGTVPRNSMKKKKKKRERTSCNVQTVSNENRKSKEKANCRAGVNWSRLCVSNAERAGEVGVKRVPGRCKHVFRDTYATAPTGIDASTVSTWRDHHDATRRIPVKMWVWK